MSTAAVKKTYKKNIVHPCCYLFRKQEKETHEAVNTALQVGIQVQIRQNFLTFGCMWKGREKLRVQFAQLH